MDMTNNKQQTAVQLIIQALDIECKSRGMNVNWDMYLELEKKQHWATWGNGVANAENEKLFQDHWNETYGGGEQ